MNKNEMPNTHTQHAMARLELELDIGRTGGRLAGAGPVWTTCRSQQDSSQFRVWSGKRCTKLLTRFKTLLWHRPLWMKLLCILSQDFAETLHQTVGVGEEGVAGSCSSSRGREVWQRNQLPYIYPCIYTTGSHANRNEINALSGSFSSIYLAISQPWPGRANQFNSLWRGYRRGDGGAVLLTFVDCGLLWLAHLTL